MMHHTYYGHCVTIILFHIKFPKTMASIDNIAMFMMLSGLGYQFTTYINIMFTNKIICGKTHQTKICLYNSET